MQKKKVLYFSHAPASMYDLITTGMPDEFEFVTLENNSDEERLEKIADADYLLLGGRHLEEKFLAASNKLKFVQFFGVGYQDFIRADQMVAKGIRLSIVPIGTGIGVSEHALMLMLAVGKRLPFLDAETRLGKWHANSLRTESTQLYGKTVGIIGLGRIGRGVARRLRGFEVKTIYHDILDFDPALEQELGVTRRSLDELLAESDIVTLHLPLTKDSRHLINAESLRKMKRGAILINCARGPIVNEDDLEAALESGALGGAGLDVFEVEPLQGPSRFAKYRNVVLTPHNAPGTRDIMEMKIEAIWDNFRRFERGQDVYDEIALPGDEIRNERRE